jgi:hypothetical protein
MMAGAAHFPRVGALRQAESPAAGGSANIFTLVIQISRAIRAVSPVKHFRIDFS